MKYPRTIQERFYIQDLQINNMDNTQKYNEAFVHVFGTQAGDLNDEYGKDTVQEWDSVHQLSLVAELEEAFDIMLDPEDIMEMTSYKSGREILKKYDIEL